ncbi:MAG: hypothetical protein P8N02_08370 [Actinomycetota bacterium]|nr:hypothetical protein [Actinomycetota bacterium]
MSALHNEPTNKRSTTNGEEVPIERAGSGARCWPGSSVPKLTRVVPDWASAGVEHLMLYFDWDGLSHEQTIHALELFAEGVMPHFHEPPAPA